MTDVAAQTVSAHEVIAERSTSWPRSRSSTCARAAARVVWQVSPAYALASVLILFGFHWGLADHPFSIQSWMADENAGVWAVNHISFPLFNAGWLPWGTALFYQVYVLKEIVTVGGIFSLSNVEILVLGRIVVYVSAMGALTMVFLLGRDLFNAWVGRAAAIVLAVTPGFTITAHYFKVEVPAVFWMLLAVWVLYRFRASGRVLTAVGAGFLAGYAAGTEYSAVVAVAAGLVMIARTDRIRPKARYYKAFGAAVVFGFLVGTPDALLDPRELLSGLRMDAVINHAGAPYAVARPPAFLDYPLNVLPFALTAPLLILSAIGLLLAATRARERLLPIFVLLAGDYLLLSIDNSRIVRATLLLAPFMALFAAFAACELRRVRLALRVVAPLVLGAFVAYAFLFSFAYVRAMANPDPRIQASEWLQRNVQTGTPIAISTTHYLDVPQLKLFGYRGIEVGQSLERLQRSGAKYLILSDMAVIPYQQAAAHYPRFRAFTTGVTASFCVTARFENSQSFAGINAKPRSGKLPFDWLYADPRITILERRTLARCPAQS